MKINATSICLKYWVCYQMIYINQHGCKQNQICFFPLLSIRPSKPIFINILTALKGNTSVSPLNHCLPHYCYIFQYSIISISTQSYINSKTSIKGINNKWSSYRELNSRPLPYQGSALPLSYMSIY